MYNIGEKPGKGTYACTNCSWRVRQTMIATACHLVATAARGKIRYVRLTEGHCNGLPLFMEARNVYLGTHFYELLNVRPPQERLDAARDLPPKVRIT